MIPPVIDISPVLVATGFLHFPAAFSVPVPSYPGRSGRRTSRWCRPKRSPIPLFRQKTPHPCRTVRSHRRSSPDRPGTPPVIFGFALKSNILNTSFLSSRQSMRTSPFIFKACDAATQSSFILTSPLCCLLQAVRFVDTKSQVSFFSLPNFLFQRYFIADTVAFQGYRPYGRQAKSHSRAI